MHQWRLLLVFIGIFHCGLSFAQEEAAPVFTGPAKMVTVESNNVITVKEGDGYPVVPYGERRPTWGKTFGLSYSTFEPANYQPNFVTAKFDEVYTRPEVPLIEMEMAVKRNASFGSFGGEISVGYYKNDSDKPLLTESSLELIPVKIGGIVLLDNYRNEPLFVPYVGGGAYIVMYKETNNDSTFQGNTQVAPYFNLGVAISLDWIDRQASRVSYEESGIEASYAFVEARTQMAAGDEQDPDFASDVNFAAGLKIEF